MRLSVLSIPYILKITSLLLFHFGLRLLSFRNEWLDLMMVLWTSYDQTQNATSKFRHYWHSVAHNKLIYEATIMMLWTKGTLMMQWQYLQCIKVPQVHRNIVKVPTVFVSYKKVLNSVELSLLLNRHFSLDCLSVARLKCFKSYWIYQGWQWFRRWRVWTPKGECVSE